MISFIIGLIGVIVGLVGWFGFHSIPLLIVGTAFYIIETIIEWKNLNDGAKLLDILIFGIGAIIGLFAKIPFYVGGMIAINIFSLVTIIFSLIRRVKRWGLK
jgi:hypothetical protein